MKGLNPLHEAIGRQRQDFVELLIDHAGASEYTAGHTISLKCKWKWDNVNFFCLLASAYAAALHQSLYVRIFGFLRVGEKNDFLDALFENEINPLRINSNSKSAMRVKYESLLKQNCNIIS